MSTDKPRVSKLRFKGDKTKKKRKHEDDDAGPSTRRRKDDDDEAPETWVLPGQPHEIRGPTFIFHPSDPSPICVTFDATRGRIVLHALDKDVKTEEGAEAPATMLDRTPTEVSQVWVTTRVAGATTINLRTGTGEGKFMSCDKHGIVSADREARGPQEEWTPIVLDDGMIAFQNVYEKYLSIDEVSGGTLALRGDSDEVGFKERFWVKIQSKYKREAHEEEKKRTEGMSIDDNADEASAKCVFIPSQANTFSPWLFSKIYQAWGAGRSVVSSVDKKEVGAHLAVFPPNAHCFLSDQEGQERRKACRKPSR